MESKARDKSGQCLCCMKSKISTDFKKILDIKDAGLVIYLYVPRINTRPDTIAPCKSITSLIEDVFILHNVNNMEIISSDVLPAIVSINIDCPRCKYIRDKAQSLLQNVHCIGKNDIIGICDHCRLKDSCSPCNVCSDIVEKFRISTTQEEERKYRVKIWLNKVKQLLKDSLFGERLKHLSHSYSDFEIDRIYKGSSILTKERPLEIENLNTYTHKYLSAEEISTVDKLYRIPQHENTVKFKTEKSYKKEITFLESSSDYIYNTDFSSDEDLLLQNVSLSTVDSPSDSVKLCRMKDDTNNVLEINGTDYTEIIPSYSANKQRTMKNNEFELHSTTIPLQQTLKSGNKIPLQHNLKNDIKDITLQNRRISDKIGNSSMKFQDYYIKRDKIKPTTKYPTSIRQYLSQDTLLTSMTDVSDILKEDFDFIFPNVVERNIKSRRRPVNSSELIKEIKDKLDSKIKKEELKRIARIRKRKDENQRKKIINNEEQKQIKEELVNINFKYVKSKSSNELTKLSIEESAYEKSISKKIANNIKTIVSDKDYIPEITFCKQTVKGRKQDFPEIGKDLKARALSRNINEPKKDKLINKIVDDLERFGDKHQNYGKVVNNKLRKEPQEKVKTANKELHREQKNNKQKEVTDDSIQKQNNKNAKRSEVTDNAVVLQKKNTVIKEKELNNPRNSLKKLTEVAGDSIKKHNVKKSEIKNNKIVLPKKDIVINETELNNPPNSLKNYNEVIDDSIKIEKIENLKRNKDNENAVILHKKDTVIKEKELNNGQDSQKMHKEVIDDSNQPNTKTEYIEEKGYPIVSQQNKRIIKEKLQLKNIPDSKIEEKYEDDPIKVNKKIDKPATKELAIDKIKCKRISSDNLILDLVKLKQSVKRDEVLKPISKYHISQLHIKRGQNDAQEKQSIYSSDTDFDVESILNKEKEEIMNIIVGQKIIQYNPQIIDKPKEGNIAPILFKSTLEEEPILEQTLHKIESTDETESNILMRGTDQEAPKGVIRYALSDRTFIDKGWTMLPTEKVVRKMNVYRMRPAHPEFDWFEHNKNKRLIQYDTGERLAEFDDNGRGRWYYRNGRLALDYYDAEEINAQQRYVVYSSGEPDERGRCHPITILATFDYLGNGIVFDHAGKIRLKYNQTEGVVLDRNIGPVTHWKWHTLNDPPVLQQVMIDTQMAHKDTGILKLAGPADDKRRPDNEEMLAIEFDNFIKEKSKKLSQKFKPFQIKMKALKINEHFSLRVLDQATVYLLYRDGSTNLKINIGMVLDHQEIVDTDTAEVGEVSNNLERLPARTDSLAGLQKSVAYAQRVERSHIERDRRLRAAEPCASADQLTAAMSRPLRPTFRTASSDSRSIGECLYKRRKPSCTGLYYDTRII
ncbi:uncharacterized protein LOC131843486 [Achroia grisella]|uniref:uncharacterized protein LOC131843486 n=1 Tax=Achroia grisella TaxID=688607 RepID=UPI0027D34C35|nr:uncharacterized protein LOC131843486 [Achroia grisella]